MEETQKLNQLEEGGQDSHTKVFERHVQPTLYEQALRAPPRIKLLGIVGLFAVIWFFNRVVFGSSGYEDIPVSLACAASLALPLFFSPVRVDDRHFLDGGLGHVAHLDLAEADGADLAIVVNPLVPVSTARRAIPTGHGARDSVRDKGLLWIYNQALRVGAHAGRSISPAHIDRRTLSAMNAPSDERRKAMWTTLPLGLVGVRSG